MPTDPTPTGTDAGAEAPSAKAERLANEAVAALQAAPEGQEQTKVTEEAQPAQAVAPNWEQILHKGSSAVNSGKPLPPLPEGLRVESAPEKVRGVLVSMGYKPATETEEAKPAPIDPRDIATGARDILDDERDVYDRDLRKALRAVTSEEEQDEAEEQLGEESIGRIIDRGLTALRSAGLDVPDEPTERMKMLDATLGHTVTRRKLTWEDRREAAEFAAECALVAKRHRATGTVDLAKHDAEFLSQVESYFTALQERKNGQERIERGDLAGAAGAGAGAGAGIPSEEQLRSMTQEEAVQLEKEGKLDLALARLPKK